MQKKKKNLWRAGSSLSIRPKQTNDLDQCFNTEQSYILLLPLLSPHMHTLWDVPLCAKVCTWSWSRRRRRKRSSIFTFVFHSRWKESVMNHISVWVSLQNQVKEQTQAWLGRECVAMAGYPATEYVQWPEWETWVNTCAESSVPVSKITCPYFQNKRPSGLMASDMKMHRWRT